MSKRQMVWIMTDSTAYSMVGCYGSPVRTPCADEMAEKGLRFDRAYTCQPVCGPARSALFTGLYPHSNGSWGNCMPLYADVKTLGQRLTASGFHCAYIGKWHLDGGDYFGYGVCPEGWDPEYWYDMKCYLDELTPEERVLSRDPQKAKDIGPDFIYGHRVTEKALAFMRDHRDEDYFLVVSYDEPHGPSLVPKEFGDMYSRTLCMNPAAAADDLNGKPALQRLWAAEAGGLDPQKRTPGAWPRFAACQTYIDSEIGRILRLAREIAPEALRLYTSDHGDAGHLHGLYAKGPAVYDEIARVPLIFEGPGVPAGGCYKHAVSQIDLPATVLDWFGLARPVMLEGLSLMDQLKDPSLPTHRPAFVEFGRYEQDHDGFGGFQPMRAAITDEYKLALHLTDTDEMYDTRRDPNDMVNVINDPAYAEARDRLHDELLDWMNRTRDPFRGYQWSCRPWRKDKTPSWAVDGYTRQRENDPGEPRQLDYATGLPMEEAVRKKPT
ncbi:MAG: sulfatase-like hydrolase/transferase [Clostridia bacterium]|nr:sulfatase-like hydrolase/transferase [Clostridia bacterium]